jgi:hypothetical protein
MSGEKDVSQEDPQKENKQLREIMAIFEEEEEGGEASQNPALAQGSLVIIKQEEGVWSVREIINYGPLEGLVEVIRYQDKQVMRIHPSHVLRVLSYEEEEEERRKQKQDCEVRKMRILLEE